MYLLGPIAIKMPKVCGLRSIKKDILKLVNTYIEGTTDLDYVKENMMLPFLGTILSDYRSTIKIAREPYVLEVIATLVNKLYVNPSSFFFRICVCYLFVILDFLDTSHTKHI